MGHGFYERYWEMQKGGPYEDGPRQQIFKCKDCGAETVPDAGWDGEPDPKGCHHDCPSQQSDWCPGRVSSRYRKNFDKIFPTAPGAGIT